MGMLAIDQVRASIRGLAGGKYERVAIGAHEWIGRKHGAHAESSVADTPLRHAHEHSVHECLVCAARATLVVVNQVEQRVIHRLPFAISGMHAEMWRRVRQPAGTRPFPLYGIWAEKTAHRVGAVVRARATVAAVALLLV